jgi:hypothetical protein
LNRSLQIVGALLVVAGVAAFALNRTGVLEVRFVPLLLIGAGIVMWRIAPRLARRLR